MQWLDKKKEKNIKIIFIISNIVLIIFNVYLLLSHKNTNTESTRSKYKNISYTVEERNTKIKEIETYLDSISSSYIVDVQTLAKARNLPSWGCGPSSYALAKILNKKFFDDQLIVDASYNNNNYEIVERFSLVQQENAVGDHSWLEIYMGDKFLFIDPTIGQFGKIHKITYQVFDVGDPTIADSLKKQYGIVDIRLSLLVPKVINRIPTSANPYPGVTIDKNFIGYFLRVTENRNQVDEGSEPEEWKDWVDMLFDKYK